MGKIAMSVERVRTGRPKEVTPALLARITSLEELPFVRQFFVGRTYNLEATKSRHGADAVIELYKTESMRNAIVVENILTDFFFTHPKSANENQQAGPPANTDGVDSLYPDVKAHPIVRVYAALWYM